MPVDNFNLQERINQVGSDTIMGFVDKMNQNDGKEQLAKLNEAVEEAREAQQNEKEVNEAAIGNADLAKMFYARPRHIRPIVKNTNVGRNDPCPCGSGKKYKNCCLSTGRYEAYSRV